MRIVEIKLDNFKNHTESIFTFTPGINAISGPNGSGKTSILEAISWTLFDYIPYKNQDNLIYNGLIDSAKQTKTASARITFISNLDNKKYTVYRNTKRQYYLVDTESNERIAETKREILPFLKKHYNLSDSTNLEELFTNTIGVPQGTLTSIFLQPGTNRKKLFDKVLNLEDYRDAYDKLREFKAYIKDQISEIEINIAKNSSNIEQISQNENDIENCNQEITTIKEEIKDLEKNLPKYETSLKEFEDISISIKETQNSIEQNTTSEKHITLSLQESETSYIESKKALKRKQELQPDYEKYLSTKDNIKILDSKRDKLRELEKKLNRKENDLQSVMSAINNYEEKINNITRIKAKIKELEPLTEEQNNLDRERKGLEVLLNQMKNTEEALTNLKIDYEEYKEQIETLKARINELENIKNIAKSFESLSTKYSNLQFGLKEAESLLKENNKMSYQVQGGMCPFLKEECQNLQDGQNLETYFENKIKEISKNENSIKLDLNEIKSALEKASKANDKYRNLEMYVIERDKIEIKLKKLLNDINNNENYLENNREIPEKLITISEKLNKLGSPLDQINALTQEIEDENAINKSIKSANVNKNMLENEMKALKSEIDHLGYNDTIYIEEKETLNKLETSYQEYIKQDIAAKKIDYFENKVSELQNQMKEIDCKIKNDQNRLNTLIATYDKDKHTKLKEETEGIKLTLAVKKEKQSNYQQKLAELKSELKKNTEFRSKIEVEQKKFDELKQIDSFVDTSRDIFKNCGALIGKFFIENISIEANQLYQDIAGKSYQTLSWNTDYEIIIEEKGFTRTFSNLSGGEQMAAALSVRLALLRELSDVNIAFFDEPTTNMDETRRTNLAGQIKNLTHFDQLFVISHDDTFEQDIDNVIRLN